ncbi:MAG TPA: hypothetical protein VLD57_00355 [Blastocatellia bacterium]|nr:hypothetical protein [Blastocatellia bacterium]
MKIVLSTLKKVLFWSYERGSWQYDLMCVLILAFIFALPTALFVNRDTESGSDAHRPMYISREEVSQSDPHSKNQDVDNHKINNIIARKYGHAVRVSRIEADKDASGNIKGYFVWE